MSHYARIVNGTVVETFTVPAGFTIGECFHPDIPGSWVECDTTQGVAQFWIYDGTNFHAPVAPG